PVKFDGHFLDLDVMTPHYGKYYSDGETPGDWMEPNPITFLTVAPGKTLMFSLASRDVRLLNQAATWLKEGMRQVGAGGKTSAGYGYFDLEAESRNSGESEDKKSVPQTQTPLPKNSLLAEVVDVSSRPLKVKLIDSGEIVTMGGISNPAGLGIENGTRLYVAPNIDKKTKRIQSVRRIGNV
ncbi:MAG: type III-B CRISPR module RAMP protein Cmr6, partial [bacterium]